MLWHPLSIDHPQLLLVCGLSSYFSTRNTYVTSPCKYPHSRGKRAPEFFELYVVYSWQERPRLKKEVGEKRPNGACVTTMNIAQPFTVHRPAFGLPTYPLRQKKGKRTHLSSLRKGNLNSEVIGGLPGPHNVLLNELVFRFQPESNVPVFPGFLINGGALITVVIQPLEIMEGQGGWGECA